MQKGKLQIWPPPPNLQICHDSTFIIFADFTHWILSDFFVESEFLPKLELQNFCRFYIQNFCKFCCRLGQSSECREYPAIAENMQKLLQINFTTKLFGSTFFFHKNEREYCRTIALISTFLRLIIVQNQTRGQLSLIQDELSDLPEVLY